MKTMRNIKEMITLTMAIMSLASFIAIALIL
jgi:hypothetical protein